MSSDLRQYTGRSKAKNVVVPKRAAAAFALTIALVVMILPMAPTAASAQPAGTTAANDPATTSPTPPAPPPPDSTPPSDHPIPSVAAAGGDPATVLPAPPSTPAGTPGQEIVERRTATSKTFVGDHSGEFRTEVYTAPIHYRDAQGRWADIKAGLGASKDGRRHNGADSFDLSVADSATDASLAAVSLDASHSVGFGLEGAANTKGKTDAKSITYFRARPRTDVRLTSRADGVKEDLVLASAAAPDRFVFPLVLRGLTASIDGNGDVVYRDEAGTERARTPHGFMTDARVDPASGEAARSTGVTYALVPRGKGVALEVRLDRQWLNDPARAYPVTVDPQVTTAAWADDTYVMSGFHRDASSDTELKVGTYDGGAHIGRSYVHFDTSFLSGATVSHAEVHAAETWSWNCANWPEAAYRVTQGWNGRTMQDFPGAAVEPNWAGGVWASGGCNNRTAIWDITGFASYWASVGETQGSISLRATDEGDNNRWKKYASTETGAPPALIVTYNHAPITPVWISPANGAHIIGSTTTATATYADADSGNGQIAFGVWNASSQLVWSAWSPSVCTWCATSVNTAPLPDGWYFLQTIGFDGQNYSPAWSPPQWFFLDTVPPPAPTILSPAPGAYVTSPVTVSARYTEPYTWSGYVLFDAIPSSGGPATAVWSGLVTNGSTATVTLPALASGTYTLYVLSSDGALSPWAPTRTFNVGTVPGAPTGLQAVAGALSALLSWTSPLTTGGPISSYTFTAIDSAGGAPIQASCSGCTTSFTMGGLTAGHSYTFTAKATNAIGAGAVSAPSNAISALLALVLTPTSVQATSGDTTATVTWTAPTVNVPGITGYNVTAYRAGDNTQLGTPATTTATSYTWPANTFRNGTPIYFTLSSTTLILTSPPSPASNTITPSGPPFAPEVVYADPGDHSATVHWQPPSARTDGTPGDNGRPITGYQVVTVTDGQPVPIKPAAADATSLTIGGLFNGKDSYRFTVQAVNDSGLGAASATSNPVVPAGPPFRPQFVTPNVIDSTQVSLFWTAPQTQSDGTPADNGSAIRWYTVLPTPACGSCQGTVVPADGMLTIQTTIRGLSPGTSYTFRVVATNAIGDSTPSDPSNPVNTPSPNPPPPPGFPGSASAVTVTFGNTTAQVDWAPSDSGGSPILDYTVRAIRPDGSEAARTVVSGSTTTASVAGLNNTTVYLFFVVARNAVGTSTVASSSPVSLRGVADSYMRLSLADFVAVRSQRPPPFEWSTDGCSGGVFGKLLPPAFLPACWRHDFGYRNYGSGLKLSPTEDTRYFIDLGLLHDLQAICDSTYQGEQRNVCRNDTAQIVYNFVRAFGSF